MKRKIYKYIGLIFLVVSNNITAQYNEGRGSDWQACDAAIRQYNHDINQCINDFTNMMYSATNLPDPNDNIYSFYRDSQQYFGVFSNPSPGEIYDVWRAVTNFYEILEAISRQQGNAMNSIADEYFSSMFGLDC